MLFHVIITRQMHIEFMLSLEKKSVIYVPNYFCNSKQIKKYYSGNQYQKLI